MHPSQGESLPHCTNRLNQTQAEGSAEAQEESQALSSTGATSTGKHKAKTLARPFDMWWGTPGRAGRAAWPVCLGSHRSQDPLGLHCSPFKGLGSPFKGFGPPFGGLGSPFKGLGSPCKGHCAEDVMHRFALRDGQETGVREGIALPLEVAKSVGIGWRPKSCCVPVWGHFVGSRSHKSQLNNHRMVQVRLAAILPW